MLTIPNLKTSIENKDTLVLDEHAKKGTFLRNSRGNLIFYAGGFSVVYPYETDNGEKWAFRCWHAEVSNSKNRYEIISEAIKNSQLKFLCEFQYVEKGINVDGSVYPTTRMRWIDGISIKDYICQNKDSKETLNALADDFLKMTQALHAKSFAHGDLQHGNILVDKKQRLYLVDYDSFYCPKLKGEADTVAGLPDYQHPKRSGNNSVTEKLDYFSELIIYLSILAIAEEPYLVDKYKVNDADRMLFSKEDYADIKNSHIYKDIQRLGKKFQDLLDVLEDYLKCESIDDLSPFDAFLFEKRILFSSSITKAVRNTQQVIIEWNVPFDAKVHLKVGKNNIIKCKNKGHISTTLTESVVCELIIESKECSEIRKKISIDVFDECEMNFLADKYFVFPTIPVKLSWNVKHAKKVWLDNEEVNETGNLIIEPSETTVYILTAEDEFGKKEKKIEINMLPIPQVKSLLVPAPDIVNNMAVSIKQSYFKVNLSLPEIKIGMIKSEHPKVLSFKDIELNVELTPPLHHFSLKKSIKKIVNHKKK